MCLQTLNIVLTGYLFQLENCPLLNSTHRKPHVRTARINGQDADKTQGNREKGPGSKLSGRASNEKRMAYKKRLGFRRQGFVFVTFKTPIYCVSLMWITGIEKAGKMDGNARAAGCGAFFIRLVQARKRSGSLPKCVMIWLRSGSWTMEAVSAAETHLRIRACFSFQRSATVST